MSKTSLVVANYTGYVTKKLQHNLPLPARLRHLLRTTLHIEYLTCDKINGYI